MIRFISYIMIFFISSLPLMANAQNWAGPDVELCGSSEGAMIGLENAPSEYCYQWSPTTGIVGPSNQARITVTPEETTTYSVTVTGSNFSFSQEDAVKVTVDFGSVEFNPGFAEPNGENNQSTAVVTNNPGNHPFTWSIVEEGAAALGCVINPTTGVISGCDEPGEITVRATRDDFPVCKAEETFEVNLGVKDIHATDMNSGNGLRRAKTGETLILVGRNGVEFKAIPNDNETFGPNDIEWAGPMAPTSGVTMWTSDQGTPTSFDVSANDKSVHVERRMSQETVLSNPLSNLFELIQSGILKFKPVKSYSGLDDIGSCVPPLDPGEPEFALNYKRETTNKFNSPDEGIKSTIEGVASITVTGRMCVPPPYSSPPNPFGFYYTYAFMSGTAKVVLSGSKDEGAAVDPSWEWNNLVGEGELKAGLGADFGTSLPGDILTVNGSITGSAAITLTAQWNKPHVEAKVKIEPLIIEGSISVWVTNPNDPIVGPINRKYNIVDPWESNFTPIFTFE